MPDFDLTPISGRVIDEEAVPRLATEIKQATITPDWRLRVDALVVGPGGLPLGPRVATIATGVAIADGVSSDELIFNIGDGTGMLGITPLVNLPRATAFSVSGTIQTAGVGNIFIYYSGAGGPAWRLFEEIPLSLYYPVDMVFTPSRGEYRIFYTDEADGAGTTSLDLDVVLYPPTK